MQRPAGTRRARARKASGTAAPGLWGLLAVWTAGCGGAASPGGYDRPLPTVAIALSDVSSAVGLPPFSSDCAAFRDLDDDGWPDILLSPTDNNGQSHGQLLALHNRGDGTFLPVTIPTSLKNAGPCEVADVDGDGHSDIAVQGSPAGGDSTFLLLRGTGSSSLTFVEQPLGVGRIPWQHEFGFFDYDNDGRLDLFAAPFNLVGLGANLDHCDAGAADFQCYLRAGTNQPAGAVVHHGLASGGFEPSPLAGAAGQTNALGFIDWDGDGFVDVFQSNDFGVDQLLHNAGGAALADALPGLGGQRYNHGMGVAFADWNGDGRWDFYGVDIGPDQLWLGQPGGGVVESAQARGLADVTRLHSGWAPLGEDFNNDGRTDLFVLNTALVESVDELRTMVQNDAASTQVVQADFALANTGTGFTTTTWPHHNAHRAPVAQGAAAAADYDGDGRLDVLVVAGDIGELRLLRNVTEAPGAHWLDVRLVTPAGNTAGRGAIVVCSDGDREVGRRAVGAEGHRIDGGLDAHFGLGPLQSVKVTVRWPGGGVSERVLGAGEIDRVVSITR